MKLFTKILQSLDEGDYQVKIKSFKGYIGKGKRDSKTKRYQNYEELNMETLTQEQLQKMQDDSNGYFVLTFETTELNPNREGKLTIWPTRFLWSMEQLATKINSDFEDTKELKDKVIPLSYQHGYYKDGTYVQNKQWSFYSATGNSNDEDEPTVELNI
jgi:hypothetical protein